ncbi:MAG: hypothetical protein FWC43_11360 [Planctomycetaceae bacterium]|nr:hypothetical protein [Planctomycetaceae bacterium]
MHYGLVDQDKVNEFATKYEEALAALRAAGGKAGSGGRCLGQMSGLESMRHADLRMTMRYTHTKLESVNDGVSKLPDFLKKDDGEAGAAVPC